RVLPRGHRRQDRRPRRPTQNLRLIQQQTVRREPAATRDRPSLDLDRVPRREPDVLPVDRLHHRLDPPLEARVRLNDVQKPLKNFTGRVGRMRRPDDRLRVDQQHTREGPGHDQLRLAILARRRYPHYAGRPTPVRALAHRGLEHVFLPLVELHPERRGQVGHVLPGVSPNAWRVTRSRRPAGGRCAAARSRQRRHPSAPAAPTRQSRRGQPGTPATTPRSRAPERHRPASPRWTPGAPSAGQAATRLPRAELHPRCRPHAVKNSVRSTSPPAWNTLPVTVMYRPTLYASMPSRRRPGCSGAVPQTCRPSPDGLTSTYAPGTRASTSRASSFGTPSTRQWSRSRHATPPPSTNPMPSPTVERRAAAYVDQVA